MLLFSSPSAGTNCMSVEILKAYAPISFISERASVILVKEVPSNALAPIVLSLQVEISATTREAQL